MSIHIVCDSVHCFSFIGQVSACSVTPRGDESFTAHICRRAVPFVAADRTTCVVLVGGRSYDHAWANVIFVCVRVCEHEVGREHGGGHYIAWSSCLHECMWGGAVWRERPVALWLNGGEVHLIPIFAFPLLGHFSVQLCCLFLWKFPTLWIVFTCISMILEVSSCTHPH